MISPELRALAESPDRHTAVSADVERVADERLCLVQGTTWAAVSDIHVAPAGVEALVEEVRALVPAEKTLVWWLGPSCEPADLHERLAALGFGEPSDRAPLLHGLACATPPPEAPADVEVRVVSTLEDATLAREVGWEAFGISAERREQERPHLRRMYEAAREAGSPVAFLAYLDGEPVGAGRSVYARQGVFLIGGAVLAHARGRGVYRALIRARWDDAVARGTPGLAVEAVPGTSYPILKNLGFEEVCTIRRLEDRR